jgi:MFS family permease
MRLRYGCMTQPSRTLVISALGVTQIFSWGSSYYLLAVLAKPIATDTGWPLSLIVGGLSLGLLAGGFASPRIGRIIEARGGRPVLAASSLLLGLGLALLATAHHLPLYFAAWLVMGVGMGAGLYDAAFATLGRAYGAEGRSAITTLTLWGGFASTVCWPISAYLVESVGWRGTCVAYAVLQIGLSLPLHWWLMPRVRSRDTGTSPPAAPAAALGTGQRRAFLLFAVLVTSGGAIASLISVHLLTFLQARGIELAAAVALGAIVGPSQVGARIVEMAFGRHYHPIWTLTAATVLIAAGLCFLALGLPLVGVALMLYGAGNGIWSIARGTFPLALFGATGYATLMGRLGLPGLLAQALSPSLAALLLDRTGPEAVLAVVAGLAVINVALTAMLWSVLERSDASLPAKETPNA